jgi:hypothetical protein
MKAFIVCLLALAIPAASPGPAFGVQISNRPRFSLRSTNPCFYAPGSGSWPVAPVGRTHAIRGSFNEPRGNAVHFGVDVQAVHDRARVYSMASGTLLSVSPHRAHFSIGGRSGTYIYWHARLLKRFSPGAHMYRGQLVARIVPGYYHVHLSESAPGCGLVDPRRPTGALHDPRNQERPRIGPITAYRGNRRAFAVHDASTNPSQQTDRATPLALSDLHGVVDFRAGITDMPIHRMRDLPQLPLEAAAIRGYLAPATNGRRVFGHIRRVFDGSGLLGPAAGLWHIWAFGTFRQNGCYFSDQATCDADYVWHVGGPRGWDVDRLPNGSYQYCVQAITINGVKEHRCTPITVRHQ